MMSSLFIAASVAALGFAAFMPSVSKGLIFKSSKRVKSAEILSVILLSL